MPVNTLTMFRGMTNAEWFTMIESTLGDFERVSEAIQMMQIEEMPKLF